MFFVIAFGLLYLFADVSSPRTSTFGGDYGIFMAMGDFWRSGGVIYSDLFDNKGPYHFLIFAIGQALCPGKWGVFMLEVINLTVCIELLYNIGRSLAYRDTQVYIAIAVTLLLFVLTVGSGGTVEEWSLPFVLLPMLLCVNFVRSGAGRHPIGYAFVYGLCFGVVAFMRVNNAAIIVGIALALMIIGLKRRLYHNLLANIFMAIIGALLASLPAIVYFAFKGAVYDMIYTNFIYNIKYKDVWMNDTSRNLVVHSLRMLGFVALSAFSIIYDYRSRRSLFVIIVCLCVITYFTFYSGAMYIHYYTMMLPIYFLLVLYSLRLSLVYRIALAIALILPVLYQDWHVQDRILTLSNLSKDFQYRSPASIMKSDFGFIPESEYTSVYTHQLPETYFDFLYQLGVQPKGKYFSQQDRVSQVDTVVGNDLVRRFEEFSPKWVLSTYPDLSVSVLGRFSKYYIIADSVDAKVGIIYVYKRIE